MDRAPRRVPLENEHARPLGIAGIVFDHDRSLQAIDDLTHENTVFGELIVAMRRDPDFATSNELDDAAKRLAHRFGASGVPWSRRSRPKSTPSSFRT
jgi:hypothetical protein